MLPNYFLRLFSLVFILNLYACSSYKNSLVVENQLTYKEFRNKQKSFLSSDGAIKYIDQGQGDVVLLLHGVPTSGWLYRNFIDTLATQYRVVVPDMLGFGSSDSPDTYDVYSEKNHAKRLLELMDFLKIDHWSQVVHDAGGLWTWELLKKDSTRINKLIILNSIINEAGFNPPIRFKPGVFAKLAMWSYRNGLTSDLMFKKLFNNGLEENTLNEIDIQGYKKPIREGKTKAMYYFFTQTCNNLPTYDYHFENLNIPVQVIWGKNDTFLPWYPQKEKVIRDFNLKEEDVKLLEAKHFIQEENREELVRLFFDFLE